MFSKASSQGRPGGSPANIGTGADSTRPTPRSAAPSIISSDLKILGDLISAGDLQVDGIVEGDIQSRSLTIGEGAVVNGNVVAETTRVCGQVTGQIKASTVTLDRTAKVVGDIIHQILAIEPGAFLEGHVRHSDPAGGSDRKSNGS
jgi:cytoskeletal protein CcmA (bactofilin family)